VVTAAAAAAGRRSLTGVCVHFHCNPLTALVVVQRCFMLQVLVQ